MLLMYLVDRGRLDCIYLLQDICNYLFLNSGAGVATGSFH